MYIGYAREGISLDTLRSIIPQMKRLIQLELPKEMLTLKEETTLTSEFNQLNISFVSPTFSHSDTRCEYYDLDSDEEDDSDSSSYNYNYIVQATTRNFHQPFENKYLFMFRTAISCSMFPWFLWNIPGSR